MATAYAVDTDGGATYDTLAEAVADLPSTLDDNYEITCTGSTDDSGGVSISVTPDGYTVTVQAANGDEASTKWDGAKYCIRSTSATLLTISTAGVRLIGLQLELGLSSANTRYAITNSAANFVIGNCHVRCTNSGANQHGIYSNASGATDNYFYNTIVQNFTQGGFNCTTGTDGGQHLDNCLAYSNSGNGIFTSYDDTIAINCVSIDNGTDYSGGARTGSDYNADSDGSADSTWGANRFTSSTPDFVDTGATQDDWDFALGASSDLEDEGTSSVSYSFTTDIDGNTRTGSWDCGPYERVAAGAPDFTGTVNVPGVVATGTLSSEETKDITGVINVPAVLATGTIGVTVDLTGTINIASVIATGGLGEIRDLTGTVNLPAVNVSGSASQSCNISGVVTLPTVVGTGGPLGVEYPVIGTITAPKVVISGTLSVSTPGTEDVTGTVNIPAVDATGTLTVEELKDITGTVNVPAVVATGEIAVSRDISGVVSVPAVIATGELTVTTAGETAIQGTVTVPAVLATGALTVHEEKDLTGTINVPAVVVTGDLSGAGASQLDQIQDLAELILARLLS